MKPTPAACDCRGTPCITINRRLYPRGTSRQRRVRSTEIHSAACWTNKRRYEFVAGWRQSLNDFSWRSDVVRGDGDFWAPNAIRIGSPAAKLAGSCRIQTLDSQDVISVWKPRQCVSVSIRVGLHDCSCRVAEAEAVPELMHENPRQVLLRSRHSRGLRSPEDVGRPDCSYLRKDACIRLDDVTQVQGISTTEGSCPSVASDPRRIPDVTPAPCCDFRSAIGDVARRCGASAVREGEARASPLSPLTP